MLHKDIVERLNSIDNCKNLDRNEFAELAAAVGAVAIGESNMGPEEFSMLADELGDFMSDLESKGKITEDDITKIALLACFIVEETNDCKEVL